MRMLSNSPLRVDDLLRIDDRGVEKKHAPGAPELLSRLRTGEGQQLPLTA